MADRIFVQIAAYRDPETLATITSALEHAAQPDRITFGLCWQYLPGTDETMLRATDIPAAVRMLSINAGDSRGVCWARSMTQSLYTGEEYTLSIDSHTQFAPDWDTGLIEELGRCGGSNPVISTYPPPYTRDNGPQTNPPCTVMLFKAMENGAPRFRTELLAEAPARPLRGLFVAGGFHFARGRLIRQVPYDPHLYFDQEEFAYALRLWTHGYDVFTPTRAFVYHLYKADDESRTLFWDDHHDQTLKQKGDLRLAHMLGLKKSGDPEVTQDLKRYGFGIVRTAQEFLKLSGIKPGQPFAEPGAYTGEFLYKLNPAVSFKTVPAD